MAEKIRVQCRLINEASPVRIWDRALVELISGHPDFKGRMPLPVITSAVLRIDTVGLYIVEFETRNTIYEVIP